MYDSKEKDENYNLRFEFNPLVRSHEFSALNIGIFGSHFYMKVP
jgi:hypothetical protein